MILTETESHYTIIELKLLAISWAVYKCRLFLTGLQHFTVLTDHNFLILILNSHCLDEVKNPRLQQLKTRLMAYNNSKRVAKTMHLTKKIPNHKVRLLSTTSAINQRCPSGRLESLSTMAMIALISKIFAGVDCCTDWPTIIPMVTNTTAQHLVATVQQFFCCTRIPGKFWSNGGPQFTPKTFHLKNLFKEICPIEFNLN